MAKWKRFNGTILYCGYNVGITFYATNQHEAALIANVELITIRKYFSARIEDKQFNGVMADIMGGSPFEEVCKLMHKQIPLEEMKKKLDVIKNGGTL
jgi:hypothetical protein